MSFQNLLGMRNKLRFTGPPCRREQVGYKCTTNSVTLKGGEEGEEIGDRKNNMPPNIDQARRTLSYKSRLVLVDVTQVKSPTS